MEFSQNIQDLNQGPLAYEAETIPLPWYTTGTERKSGEKTFINKHIFQLNVHFATKSSKPLVTSSNPGSDLGKFAL